MGLEPAVVMAVATAVSTAVSIGATIYATQQQAAAADRQADIARVQGEQAQLAAEAEAEDRRRRSRYLLGQQLAAAGMSGVALEGSPLLAMVESGVQENLEARRILYKGRLGAVGAASDAALAEAQAETYRTSGYIQAGTSLLRGGTQAYGYKTYGSQWKGW